jgi:hypothetical protein
MRGAQVKFRIAALGAVLILSSSCSSQDDAASACAELNTLIKSLDTNEIDSISNFHGTVDAILIHARNVASQDRDFAQLANKVQAFASIWYAKSGNTVPNSTEAITLKEVSNEFCNTTYSI